MNQIRHISDLWSLNFVPCHLTLNSEIKPLSSGLRALTSDPWSLNPDLAYEIHVAEKPKIFSNKMQKEDTLEKESSFSVKLLKSFIVFGENDLFPFNTRREESKKAKGRVCEISFAVGV